MSTYKGFDGAPVGEFTVTVVKAQAVDEEGDPVKNLLPAKYGTAAKSPLKVAIKAGTNDVELDLTSK